MLMAATAALRSLAQNHVRVPRKHEWAAIDCEHAIANKVKKKPPGTLAAFFDATP